MDKRDLNYDKYFVRGSWNFKQIEAYTSHNTARFDVEGVEQKLLRLPFIKT